MPLHRHIAPDLVLAFATPVLVRKFPEAADLNARLRPLILDAMGDAGRTERSNVGGWRSGPDFFSWPHPEVGEVMRMLAESVCRMTAFTLEREQLSADIQAEAWVNVLVDGAYNFPHTHPSSMWSAVYYVDIGAAPAEGSAAGNIEFIDPRSAVEMLPIPGQPFTGRLTFVPEPGMLLMFPGWLYHYVHPYRGEAPRISIAMNVTGVRPQA